MSDSSKFIDDISKLMNEAAGVADGVRREAETAFKSQMERVIADLDLVKREDFDVVREIVLAQDEEISALRKELNALKRRKRSSS